MYNSPTIDISTHAPLARRDMCFRNYRRSGFVFLLTRLSRGATTSNLVNYDDRPISTHAPLARRDYWPATANNNQNISTHAPLARRDFSKRCQSAQLHHFYSRASREARLKSEWVSTVKEYFYSRASREARLIVVCLKLSIMIFLLTRLSRGATEAD